MSQEAPKPIINQDGSYNEKALQEQFGLGIAEASQRVRFGSYTGTVAEMLTDAKCPVGGMLRRAHQDGGLQAVETQFAALTMMDPNFKVVITEETREKHQKKNR